MSFENDQSVATELKTFTENDADLYRQITSSILKNLATKKVRGIYKPELAEKAFMYLAEAGSKKYAREFGGDESQWHTMFPIGVRRLVCKDWREEFETEYGYGNYDNILPKKYQDSPVVKRRQAANQSRIARARE